MFRIRDICVTPGYSRINGLPPVPTLNPTPEPTPVPSFEPTPVPTMDNMCCLTTDYSSAYWQGCHDAADPNLGDNYTVYTYMYIAYILPVNDFPQVRFPVVTTVLRTPVWTGCPAAPTWPPGKKLFTRTLWTTSTSEWAPSGPTKVSPPFPPLSWPYRHSVFVLY